MPDDVTHEDRIALKEIVERAIRSEPWSSATELLVGNLRAREPGGSNERAKAFALIFIDALIDRFLETRKEIEDGKYDADR